MSPRPSILIPGIQGSSLEDYYPMDPSMAWSTLGIIENKIFGPDFDALALDDTARVDFGPEVVMRPYQALGIAYASLVRSLRGHAKAPTYLFPYDWRYSVMRAGRRLAELLDVVLAKTQASRLAGWDGKVDVVCHSLGGLVLRAYLATVTETPIGSVVFIATPHAGSVDAIEMMIRGESSLLGGSKEMRKLARTFPSVYELLPRFPCASMDGTDLDIWKVENWQDNVRDVHQAPYVVEKKHLDDAAAVLASLPLPMDRGIAAADVLTIYGNHAGSTMVHIDVAPNLEEESQRWYDFDLPKDAGDGVVPVGSALLSGTAAVEIAWDDVSYFALRARYGSLHAFLPTLDEVATVVSRFFEGKRGVEVLPRGVDAARYQVVP